MKTQRRGAEWPSFVIQTANVISKLQVNTTSMPCERVMDRIMKTNRQGSASEWNHVCTNTGDGTRDLSFFKKIHALLRLLDPSIVGVREEPVTSTCYRPSLSILS